MYFTSANYTMGGNFKINKAGPIDNRSTVAKLIHLSDSNIFEGFTYNGMLVSVVDDSENNGIYRLEDKNTLTWKKEGGGGSASLLQTTGDSETEGMSQDAITKELNNKVDKDGDKQLSEENYTASEKAKLANMTDNFKSGFANATARDAKLTNPEDDWYVLMYDTDTIWYYKDGAWTDTGSKSSGDMLKAIYDPTGIAKDAFLMSNMVETIDKKIFTATERSKLDGIQPGAQVNTVNKVNNKTGDVVLTKDDIGLEKVNNTADNEKVVAEAAKVRNSLIINGIEYDGSEEKVIDITGGGGVTGDYNNLSNRPSFKTINNQFIIGNGNIDIKSELYNYGFNLKGIYSSLSELEADEDNPKHKDTDIWMTKESYDFVMVEEKPYYIAPDGDDDTGDGSYDNPYRTFEKIPKNSLIKLKAGDYRGSEYGYFNLSYGKVHGLFKGLMSGESTSDTRPDNNRAILIPEDYKTKLLAISSAFTRMTTFSIITKESDDAIVNIIDDVGTDTEAKPWFRFYGATTDLWIFKNLKFTREIKLTSTGTSSSIVLMESQNPKVLMVEDCIFECSGGIYGYNYSTSSYVVFNRCKFKNGTLSHKGPAVILDNDSSDVYRDAVDIIPTSLYIYYANQGKFIPFSLPKTVDGNPYPVKIQGLSELPSPKIGIEVLTPERCPVNGKPFYSKIIDCGFIPTIANHYWEKELDIDNPAATIDFITPDYRNSFIIVPDYGAFSFGMPQTWHPVGHNVSFYIDNYKIAIGTASPTNGDKKLYCAVRYTKTADTASTPAALVGTTKRGAPGPKGQDGTVAFNDLTEEQKEELTRNKYVRIRESDNLLYYNKNDNIAYLDVLPSQNLRLTDIVVKTEEDDEYTVPVTQVIDEPKEIGEYKYVNINYDADIFRDNSSIAFFPLKNNFKSHDGLLSFKNHHEQTDVVATVIPDNVLSSETNICVASEDQNITSDSLSNTIPTEITGHSVSIFFKTDNVSIVQSLLWLRNFQVVIHGKLIVIIDRDKTSNQFRRYSVTLANNTWYHLVVNIANTVTSSTVFINSVSRALGTLTNTSRNKAREVSLQSELILAGSNVNTSYAREGYRIYNFRVFDRHLTQAEINTLYAVDREALELYHGSGSELKDAKVISTTINLPVPKAPNEAGALKLGLKKDDLYINSSNGLSIVTSDT